MAERKSIFSQSKITITAQNVTETLLNIKNDDINNKNTTNYKTVKIEKGYVKKHINLTFKEDCIKKIKNIAKQNNLSVSALLEQIIEQL